MDTCLPQRIETFVRISEKFELTNFELSERLYWDLIANEQAAKKFIPMSTVSKRH